MEDYIEVPPIPKTPTPHEVVQRLENLPTYKVVWFDDPALDGFGVYINYIHSEDHWDDAKVDIDIIQKRPQEIYKEELVARRQAIKDRNKVIRQNENIQKRNDKLKKKQEEAQAADPEFQEYLRLKEKFGE